MFFNSKSIESFFAFKYVFKYEKLKLDNSENGWNVYHSIHEFKRMGILNTDDENKVKRIFLFLL